MNKLLRKLKKNPQEKQVCLCLNEDCSWNEALDKHPDESLACPTCGQDMTHDPALERMLNQAAAFFIDLQSSG